MPKANEPLQRPGFQSIGRPEMGKLHPPVRMYDPARPFGIAHFRRHGPLALSLAPSRGSLDRDSSLRKKPDEMRWPIFTNWRTAQYLGYLSQRVMRVALCRRAA